MIKITKDTKFDMFYNGTEYMDHKQLTISDLYNEIATWAECMGKNRKYLYGSEIGWYAPKNYRNINKIKLLNYAKIAYEQLNYIVCITGEVQRESFSKILVGESSVLKEVYESNYIQKQEKLRKKYIDLQK